MRENIFHKYTKAFFALCIILQASVIDSSFIIAQPYVALGGHFPYIHTNVSIRENAQYLENAYKDHAAIALSLGYKLPGTKFDFELAYTRYEAQVYLNLMNHPRVKGASSESVGTLRSWVLSGNYFFGYKSRCPFIRHIGVGPRIGFCFLQRPFFGPGLSRFSTEDDGVIFEELLVKDTTNEGFHLLIGPQIQFRIFKFQRFSFLVQSGYQWGLSEWGNVYVEYWSKDVGNSKVLLETKGTNFFLNLKLAYTFGKLK